MTARPEDIRNIAIVGHGSAGKTTLADQFLVQTGTVSSHPSVDAGTSICDFDEEEKHHKYSIEAAVTHFTHAGKTFHVIDCPGYPELIGQTIGALRAVELALVAIDAHSGIKVNTRRVFKEATDAGIGKAIVITKMDTDNIDVPGLLANIKEVFGNGCVPINVPLGQGADFQGVASTLEVPDSFEHAVISPAEIHDIAGGIDRRSRRYADGEVPRRRGSARG